MLKLQYIYLQSDNVPSSLADDIYRLQQNRQECAEEQAEVEVCFSIVAILRMYAAT